MSEETFAKSINDSLPEKELEKKSTLWVRIIVRVITGWIIILICMVGFSIIWEFLRSFGDVGFTLLDITIISLFISGLILLFSGVAFILGTVFSFILKRLTNND